MNDAIEHDGAGERRTSQLFDALADEHRRFVLGALNEAGTPVDVADLARRVAVRLHGGDDGADRRPPAPPEDAVHRVHVSLHHAHLPKLDDVGLVEYDPNRQVVRAAADPPDFPGL